MAEQIVSNISYDRRDERGWLIWGISVSLDINTSPRAEVEGQEAYGATGKLAIDLSGLDYLSSARLRVLLRLGKRAQKGGQSGSHGLLPEKRG